MNAEYEIVSRVQRDLEGALTNTRRYCVQARPPSPLAHPPE
jgi:hypothetical protein